jgi:hypothetical protein
VGGRGGGGGWSNCVKRLVQSHFAAYAATMHCGHLSAPIALHPNPNLNPLLPSLRLDPFPTRLAVVGFIDLMYLQSPPTLTQFVLVGTEAETTKADDASPAALALDSDAKEGAKEKGDKGERRAARAAAAAAAAPPPLPPLAALLRSVLRPECGGDRKKEKEGVGRVPGSLPAAMVLLGSWAGAHAGGLEAERGSGVGVGVGVGSSMGGTGGIGYVTAEADEKSGGHHLLLTLLDAEAAAEMPSLVGSTKTNDHRRGLPYFFDPCCKEIRSHGKPASYQRLRT